MKKWSLVLSYTFDLDTCAELCGPYMYIIMYYCVAQLWSTSSKSRTWHACRHMTCMQAHIHTAGTHAHMYAHTHTHTHTHWQSYWIWCECKAGLTMCAIPVDSSSSSFWDQQQHTQEKEPMVVKINFDPIFLMKRKQTQSIHVSIKYISGNLWQNLLSNFLQDNTTRNLKVTYEFLKLQLLLDYGNQCIH